MTTYRLLIRTSLALAALHRRSHNMSASSLLASRAAARPAVQLRGRPAGRAPLLAARRTIAVRAEFDIDNSSILVGRCECWRWCGLGLPLSSAGSGALLAGSAALCKDC